MLETRDKKLIKLWLWTGIVLVTSMVIIGGITRLTGSGLSIVKWKIVTGVLPPLSENQWSEAFEEYKQTPQFRQINQNFTVHDFKGIYWWEYFHRLVARIAGIIFIFPFVYFLLKRALPSWLIRKLVLIFILGGLQGLMGWVMVKSGLNDLPYVSHYRLALHLCLALLVIGVILWTILKIDSSEKRTNSTPWLFYIGLVLFFTQTILGAFVAGLKAGFYYNTFPLMGDALIPENLFASFQNGVFIQFAHRWFAFIFAGFVVTVWIKYKNDPSPMLRKTVNLLLSLTLFQLVLGILTLLYSIPLVLGVLHQLTAVFIFACMIKMTFAFTKTKHLTEMSPSQG
jgi:heme a synthase